MNKPFTQPNAFPEQRRGRHGEAAGALPLKERFHLVASAAQHVESAVRIADWAIVRDEKARHLDALIDNQPVDSQPAQAVQPAVVRIAQPALSEVALPVVSSSNEIILAEQPSMPAEMASTSEPASVIESIGNSALDLSHIRNLVQDNYSSHEPTTYKQQLDAHPRMDFDTTDAALADIGYVQESYDLAA